jgi:hypothetical protein
MKHFYNNVFDNNVDLAAFLRVNIPKRYYDKIFKNYTYTVSEGYGP